MKKSTIIKDLIEMLSTQLSNVKYIDKDWGQLGMEQPPVGWPCILIDIEDVSIRKQSDGNEHAAATVVLTVANRRTTSSSAHASSSSKEKSMTTIDLTDDIHNLVQDYAANGALYSKLKEQMFYKQNDLPGAEIYVMRYTTSYNVREEMIQTPN